VAGLFYPGDAERCRSAAEALLAAGQAEARKNKSQRVPAGKSVGAIVPHASWVCSGAIAAEAIAAAAIASASVDLVVVFGAIHTPVLVEKGILDSHARWAVPGGESEIAAAVAGELTANARQFVVDERFHRREHAVEVELPLIQLAWPGAKVLPIEMPPRQEAVEFGQRVARCVAGAGLSAVYLASSDLTHYGPDYGFTPAGVGEQGLTWAMDNDRRLLDIVSEMRFQDIVPQVEQHANACGAGAIAAMMSACAAGGAKRAIVLRHQNSRQTLAKVAPQPPTNAVGYAGVWIG
jgi:hypothetical protein